MREPISRDSAAPRELAEATRRLDRALEQLAAACAAKGSAAVVSPDDGASTTLQWAALESDRTRLAAELEAARVREAELESAAAAASQALGRAADEVRAVLGEGEGAATSEGQTSEGQTSEGKASGGDGLNEEAA